MFSAPVTAAILWAIILGGAGGLLTEIGSWYHALRKPRWQPPDWLFGPAWTVILGLAAWAAVTGWTAATSDSERLSLVIVYAANFVFHFLWSPLFFRYRRPDWALVEVLFLWFSVAAMLFVTARLSLAAGLMILPYLLWVSFAAMLNAKIVQLNRPFV
ncbi:MAG: TspO/MBR family protein [Pseudomonadota bacterium]